ncbi:hypothetical protein NW754_013029 [Fusarium falciforme]|nr:hypothetical protein NW754_013029 [Fusarium falciforme]KAJ4208082.1 hypothetical protein NW767_002307 [Fusarium falciforme]KAJ4259401.1 hypothetical protein NW757_002725 [Fusarium falciforme]
MGTPMPSRVLEPRTQRGYRGNSMVTSHLSQARGGDLGLEGANRKQPIDSTLCRAWMSVQGFCFFGGHGIEPKLPQAPPAYGLRPDNEPFYSLSLPMQSKSKG